MNQAQLLARFSSLPPDKQSAVLDFVESLASRNPAQWFRKLRRMTVKIRLLN